MAEAKSFTAKSRAWHPAWIMAPRPHAAVEPHQGPREGKRSLDVNIRRAFLATTAIACIATAAQAATSSGTLTVTGTVESSISLTVESAGGTTSGTGTAAATSDLGNISKYGSAPTGFTLARGASNWTISSTVGVQVDKANLTSTDYTLTAQLGSAPASGVTWKLNGSTL